MENRSVSLYETDRNVKKGFLESSQNESNVAEGILKREKTSSKNLLGKRDIFLSKNAQRKIKIMRQDL